MLSTFGETGPLTGEGLLKSLNSVTGTAHKTVETPCKGRYFVQFFYNVFVSVFVLIQKLKNILDMRSSSYVASVKFF